MPEIQFNHQRRLRESVMKKISWVLLMKPQVPTTHHYPFVIVPNQIRVSKFLSHYFTSHIPCVSSVFKDTLQNYLMNFLYIPFDVVESDSKRLASKPS